MPQLSFVKAATDFKHDVEEDEFCRWNSWKQCHDAFSRLRHQRGKEDELAVRLGFFLADWGMYRGSSFLSHKDYRIHLKAISVLKKTKYDLLDRISLHDVDDTAAHLMEKLAEELDAAYAAGTGIVDNVILNGGVKPTDLLDTKIMLGVFGCVPAYDRFVKKAMGDLNIQPSKFGEQSVLALVKFAKNHVQDIEAAKKILMDGTKGAAYPDMRILDMGLWSFGEELLENK